MAWKHGFVIEYAPRRKSKKRKRRGKAAAKRVGKPQARGVHPAKRAADPQVGSVLSVRGLTIGRRICDKEGRIGHVVLLTRKETMIEFDDGSTGRFLVPEDFSDGKVRVVKGRR